MKRIIIYILFMVFLMIFPVTVYAADNNDVSGISITVVIPQTEQKKENPPPEPTTKPTINYLYPVSVVESQYNGKNEIVKTYELSANEKPTNIARESFTRDGWLYELSDITKEDTSNTDVREHTETITINTATNDIAAILLLLEPEMEYKSSTGYTGILSLDISSITVETEGTKSSSYTISATREYPHLSSNDTSLIPKTIIDNGRTLTLSNIDWRVQNYTTIDYEQIPDSYTAVVTYTGTASKTTVTGYTTTAEYRGKLSKTIKGKTVYTAYFVGIPIISPTVNEPDVTEPAVSETTQEIISDVTEYPTQELPTETIFVEIELTDEIISSSETEIAQENKTQPKQELYNPLLIIIFILQIAILCGFAAYIVIKRKQNNKEEINNK